MKWLGKLERRFGRFGIHNLMLYVVLTMGLVYVADLFVLGGGLLPLLNFDRAAILNGEVWRLITFIFLPPNSSFLLIFISLYFYYLIGTTLEREWGKFSFTVFYLIGVLGTIASGFIMGYATNTYLNMSLFFAFAILYPNMEFRLFFFLPVKAKYLAILDAVFFIISFIFASNWGERLSLIVSLLNVAVFFGPTFFKGLGPKLRHIQTRRNFKREVRKGERARRDRDKQ